MAQVLIRNIPDDTIAVYKDRARRKGHSLEQEMRELIERNKPMTSDELIAASRRLRKDFALDFDVKAAIRWGRDDEGPQAENARDRS